MIGRYLLILALVGCGPSGKYPNRPISLICPWAPGGGTDSVSRQVAALLERDLGVPVNVENATGGAGVTGHSRGAQAKPDGYTLTMMTVELNMLHWRGLTKISPRDFTPIALLNRDAAAVFVKAESEWKTLRDLRESGSKLRASGSAEWSIWHLALAGWLKPTDMTWVPHNGSAPSLQELIAGGVDVVCCSVPEAASQLASKQVRCLGVMSREPPAAFPDVPTFRGQGVEWDLLGWRGIGVPRGTPKEAVLTLEAALRRVLTGREFLAFMASNGFDARFESGDAFRKLLEAEDTRLGAMLTSDAFKPMAANRFGPMLFPAILGTLLIAVLVALAAKGGFKRPAGLEAVSRSELLRIGEVVLGVALYMVLSGTLGFIPTAAILLFLFLLRLGTRPWIAAATAVVLVPATYQLFAGVLHVSLPHGLLGW